MEIDPGRQEEMTLADRFALGALNAANEMAGIVYHTEDEWAEAVARNAYLLADKMLVARASFTPHSQSIGAYDCYSGTNCGQADCVAHGGHGGDS